MKAARRLRWWPALAGAAGLAGLLALLLLGPLSVMAWLAREEGLEAQLLGLGFGVDVNDRRLRLPGWGLR
jgi:hypothetical protein